MTHVLFNNRKKHGILFALQGHHFHLSVILQAFIFLGGQLISTETRQNLTIL